jgi:2-phospho-L-lactate transferase/gluconeogenesis factor (CofD/UPF0052 family)
MIPAQAIKGLTHLKVNEDDESDEFHLYGEKRHRTNSTKKLIDLIEANKKLRSVFLSSHHIMQATSELSSAPKIKALLLGRSTSPSLSNLLNYHS